MKYIAGHHDLSIPPPDFTLFPETKRHESTFCEQETGLFHSADCKPLKLLEKHDTPMVKTESL